MVMGTIGYMSPEQIKGKPADARSDIFSFGAIFYEMLSGKRAFHADSAGETMAAILKEEPPDLSVTNQAISPGLERIVRHCLEKNPEQRFHSAHDLAFDIEALSGTSGQAGVVAPTRRRLHLAPALLLGAGVLAGAAAAYLLLRGDVRQRPRPARRDLPPAHEPSGAENPRRSPPTGRPSRSFTARRSRARVGAARHGPQADRPDARLRSHELLAGFSPDGSLIAYGSRCGDGGLFIMGASGENAAAWRLSGPTLPGPRTGASSCSPRRRSSTLTAARARASTGASRSGSGSPEDLRAGRHSAERLATRTCASRTGRCPRAAASATSGRSPTGARSRRKGRAGDTGSGRRLEPGLVAGRQGRSTS